MDVDFELVQLLYNNGFKLKAHNSCVYLNFLHLKKKKEEDTLNLFLSFVRISKFSQMFKNGVMSWFSLHSPLTININNMIMT